MNLITQSKLEKLNVDTSKNPTILSLCTGYGGLERGIESVIGKCTGLAYVEIEAFAVANLVNKMETGKLDPVPIWTDLKTFDARPFRGAVDIITGGYPCQPFSAAGKRNGTEDPRHLWPYIRTIVMDCKPRQCFFENVEGHLTLGVSEVLSDLEAMGYRSEVGIFSASEVGAPHQRKRVFILADRKRERLERHPGNGSRCNGQIREVQEQNRTTCKERLYLWPSRPGEPQHEWEQPRIVADTKDTDRWTGKEGVETKKKQRGNRSSNECRQLVNTGSEKRQRLPQSKGRLKDRKTWNPSGKRETESELGRATNGTRNRVDRLRLLGNGVVWQTAAKAYYTLSQKL